MFRPLLGHLQALWGKDPYIYICVCVCTGIYPYIWIYIYSIYWNPIYKGWIKSSGNSSIVLKLLYYLR